MFINFIQYRFDNSHKKMAASQSNLTVPAERAMRQEKEDDSLVY
jgi:hypothetical protein